MLGPITRIVDAWAALLSGMLSGALNTALATLGTILVSLCCLAFPFIYRRYVGILGASAKRKGTVEREYYEAFRHSLTQDNLGTRLYASKLRAFLDWVDRFFGDAGT